MARSTRISPTSSEVVEIDAKSATVTKRWPTGTCKQPVSMAIDTAHHRLFSGCRSGVMAISDYQAGKVVATVPIGTGVDGAGYDPGIRRRVRLKRQRNAHRDSSGHAGHNITSLRTYRRRRVRATWGSTPQITGYSSSQPTSDRHPLVDAAGPPFCRGHSNCW